MKLIFLALVSAVAGLAFFACHALPQRDTPVPRAGLDAPGFVRTYCANCHSNGRAVIDLDGIVDARALREDHPSWQRVLQMVRSGKMPPKRFPQPSKNEREQMVTWLEAELAKAKVQSAGRYRIRRLRRHEYQNTIRDLLQVSPPIAANLPEDDDRGWDVASKLPRLTPVLLKLYGAAADQALAEANLGKLLPEYVPEYLFASAVLLNQSSPSASLDTEVAKALLSSFARSAYRRTPTVEEVRTLMEHYGEATEEGLDYQDSLKRAMWHVLLAPQFLYCIEDSVAAESSPLPEYELASRLSYFLWSSTPDRELLDLAEAAELRSNLSNQARRLLHDPRAREFATRFANFWLELDQPGREDLDISLWQAMTMETRLFVNAIIFEDRKVREIIDADYSYLNERLARHYGISGVTGDNFRRVALAGTERGGLLGQASILTLSSRSLEASPVQRGKWILDNVLGTPPPPPPPGLLEAFASTRKAFTTGSTAERLKQHRDHASCATCHSKIDGLGMALDNFDGIGVFRERPNSSANSAPLADGQVLIDLMDLRRYLRERHAGVAGALASRLLNYALLSKHTQPMELDPADKDMRFSELIAAVVISQPFQSGKFE